MGMTDMASAKNDVKLQDNITSDMLESTLWQALDMDTLQNEMVSSVSFEREAMFMGTGATVNACYHCDNSHKNC